MTRMMTTSETLARAALAFIDEHGVDTLTIRALGQKVGMHHTAVYRHYRSKNELLRAVFGIVIANSFETSGSLPEDPKARIFALIAALRAALREHPAVTVAYLLPVETLADSDAVEQVHLVAVEALRELGLEGHELVVRYQMLESYALGTTVFDFGGAPNHVTSRRRRHAMLAIPELSALAASNEHVAAVSEEAFALGLRTLIDECAEAGQRASSRGPTKTRPAKN